jgi:hypothetical protein
MGAADDRGTSKPGSRWASAFQRNGRVIYVPTFGSYLRRTISSGSGIVGTTVPGTDPPQVIIDYEGAIYGQAMSYAEKVYHAFGRHTWQGRGYPTVARTTVPASELVEVGTLRPIAEPPWIELDITREDVVEEWLSSSPRFELPAMPDPDEADR